jgi:cytochrome c551/c552
MKQFAAFSLTFLGVLAIVAGVQAQCRTVVRAQVVHQAAVHHAYVAPAAIAVYQPIPVFNVGYTDNGATQLLQQEIQLMRFQMLQMQQQLIAPGGVVPNQQSLPVQQKQQLPVPQKLGTGSQDHPAIVLMQKNCASCHAETTAKVKGGGFTMFSQAGIAAFSDRQALGIAREVFSGRMPKNSKMSDEDVGQIMDWLDSVK